MSDENRKQIDYWNGRQGERWVAHQESLDRVWRPVGDAVIERAAPLRGERVIDIGCGCGGMALELVARVGPTGSVVGIDVSGPMLARARERALSQGASNLEFVQSDASTHRFAGNADLAFSRAGVMFFADPVAAFTNLRRALRPGGRTVFVCFRDRELNTWMTVPLSAAASVVGAEAPAPPHEPGPFALSDEGRLRAILQGAGFVGTLCEPLDHDLVLGADVALAADFSIHAGPTARVLADANTEIRERVRDVVMQSLSRYASSTGVSLRAATWVVKATVPLAS
jgi:SAM-dependent methyltransferase